MIALLILLCCFISNVTFCGKFNFKFIKYKSKENECLVLSGSRVLNKKCNPEIPKEMFLEIVKHGDINQQMSNFVALRRCSKKIKNMLDESCLGGHLFSKHFKQRCDDKQAPPSAFFWAAKKRYYFLFPSFFNMPTDNGVNMRDAGGDTVLMHLCEYDHSPVGIKMLLEHSGTNIWQKNKSGRTAFEKMAYYQPENVKIFEILSPDQFTNNLTLVNSLKRMNREITHCRRALAVIDCLSIAVLGISSYLIYREHTVDKCNDFIDKCISTCSLYDNKMNALATEVFPMIGGTIIGMMGIKFYGSKILHARKRQRKFLSSEKRATNFDQLALGKPLDALIRKQKTSLVYLRAILAISIGFMHMKILENIIEGPLECKAFESPALDLFFSLGTIMTVLSWIIHFTRVMYNLDCM